MEAVEASLAEALEAAEAAPGRSIIDYDTQKGELFWLTLLRYFIKFLRQVELSAQTQREFTPVF